MTLTAPRPFFSVIVPVFNRAHLIGRALDSVLTQTFSDFEILVVDDASVDRISEALFPYVGKIRYIRNARNSNGAFSRNVGVAAALGYYVAFLDSDDVWDADKLRRSWEVIQKAGAREDVVFFHALYYCDKPKLGSSLVLPKAPYGGGRIARYLLVDDGLIQTSCMIGARSIFSRVTFDSTLRKHQDWDLCIRLANAGFSFQYFSDALTFWDQMNENRTSFGATELSKYWIEKISRLLDVDELVAVRAKVLGPALLREGRLIEGLSLLLNGYARCLISGWFVVSAVFNYGPLWQIKNAVRRVRRLRRATA